MEETIMKAVSTIQLLLLLLLTSGCVSDFVPAGITSSAGILVVEGSIEEPYGTTIRLTRTKELNSNLPNEAVTSAQLTIIRSDGSTLATLEPVAGQPGYYSVTHDIHLQAEETYALAIVIGDRHYRSTFQSPMYSPEIDEVTWQSKADGYEVDVRVSAHDPENQIKHFLWKYEEDWEIKAEYATNYRYDSALKTVVEVFNPSYGDRYYCWDSNRSTSLLLGSMDNLSESRIKDKVLLNLKAGDTRFSFLYSILVKQYALSKEAYRYFRNMQGNIDNVGSIFAPQPTEMEGNITCISHPDETVTGFVYISTVTTKRIYIDARDVPLMKKIINCWEPTPSDLEYSYTPAKAYMTSLGIYLFIPESMAYRYRSILCMDCTFLGGNKQKPAFWPNDHQ